MNKIKFAFISIFGAIFSFLGILAVPVFLLIGCNFIDYATGLAAAKYRNPEAERPITSYKSIRGIIKKVCMYLLIIVGWFVDIMINQGLTSFNVQIPYIVATAISCWLIFNEMLSILENMEDIGVAIPPFLKPILKLMKKKSEESMNTEKKGE